MNSGRYILEHGIPHIEPFTIHEGLHFVLSPWLTCVIFWKIYDLLGANGVIAFAGIIGAIIIGLYYRICLLVSDGNRRISMVLAALTGLTISYFEWIVTRPQVLSTLLLLLEILLLENFARSKNTKYLYPIPLISLLVINLHATLWTMTFIVLLPFIAASFHFTRFDDYFSSGNIPLKPLLITAGGILLAGFLNPYGTESMLYVFRSLDWYQLSFISEIHPPTIHSIFGKTLMLWSISMLVMYARKPAPLQYVLLTLGLTVMGFQAVRSLFLFFVLGTFPTAYLLRTVNFSSIADLISVRENSGSLKHSLLLISLLILFSLDLLVVSTINSMEVEPISFAQKMFLDIACVAVFFVVLEKNSEGNRFDLSALPKKSLASFLLLALIFSVEFFGFRFKHASSDDYLKPIVDDLLQRESAENIVLYTSFNTGSYTEFRGIRSYLDPRAEIFFFKNNHQKDILQEWLDLRNGILYYKEFFSRYNFTHILVSSEYDPVLYQALSHDKNYRMIIEHEAVSVRQHTIFRVFEPVVRLERPWERE